MTATWQGTATKTGRWWRGLVEARSDTGKPVVHLCPHSHRARSTAEGCAERAAARLVRTGHVPGTPLP